MNKPEKIDNEQGNEFNSLSPVIFLPDYKGQKKTKLRGIEQ
jgi:hypothetical protein